MSRFADEIDLDNRNDSRALLAALVGEDRAVLDVGCGSAALARALVARGCRLSGISDGAAAEPDSTLFEDLVAADIDEVPLSTHFKPESFDAVLVAETLGRLRDPEAVLRDAVQLLAPGGRILVSVRNAAHGSTRLALLQGRWPGQPDGTPERQFTEATLCRLLETAGLAVEELRATVRDPLDTGTDADAGEDAAEGLNADRLPPTVVEWVRHQPQALDHEYVAAARPLAAGETRSDRPRSEPAVPVTRVRREDEHTARLQEEQRERHRLLTVRDHIIGLEASLASAQARTKRANTRARFADRRNRRLREELEWLTDEIDRLAQSKPSRQDMERIAHRLRQAKDAEER